MPEDATHRRIGGEAVHGLDVDAETRCAHYDGDTDVIAIRFACCGEFYPCYRCHDALVDHDRAVWSIAERDVPAVLCGDCGSTLSIASYLGANDACPNCDAAFNPGCREHHDRYFGPTHE